jgi:chromosome partitioning protein
MSIKRLAVINQKGGVGKTTISANLGHALALSGQRVLLVDMDPQGHLAACLGLFKSPQQGVDALLLEGADLQGLIHKGRDGLGLLPAGPDLAQVEELQQGGAARARLLQDALEVADLDGWDWIIFDCPPMFGILMANVLMVADLALVPVNSDYLSLNGLARLLETIKRFESIRETGLEVWIALSRFHPRRRISMDVIKHLAQALPGRTLATAIKESSILTECPSLGRTVFEYRQHSGAAQDFMNLAEDLRQGRVLEES